jgi:shikimate kinase
MKIILIGFMGAGKSSIAKVLSDFLHLPILEMDDLVYQKTNCKTMSEVFTKGGELLLRETEIQIAKECIDTDQIIISTGAGIVMNKIIIDYFKVHASQIFFLNTSFPLITDRLANDTSRPLFNDIIRAKALYDLRQPLYFAYADNVINVENKSIKEIALEIVATMGL